MPDHEHIVRLNFADDTLLFVVNNRPDYAANQLELHAQRLIHHLADWKIKINPAKSEYATILGKCVDTQRSLRDRARHSSITLGGQHIKRVDSFRYLGLTFQLNATYVNHINNTLRRANAVGAQLSHLLRSKHIDIHSKTMLYKQTIKPILTYGSYVWACPSHTSSSQFERVRKFERRMLRYCTNTFRVNGKYVRSSRLYEKAKIQRIDASIAHLAIGFYNRQKHSADASINALAGEQPNTGSIKYKPAAHLLHLHNRNQLLTDGKLLLFNRAKFGPPRTLYVTDQ